jgi:hypothetical protein
MPDAVAAFDLDYCAMAAAELALTLGQVVDAAGADRRGLAVLAVFPQVRAEVGHQANHRLRFVYMQPDCLKAKFRSRQLLSQARHTVYHLGMLYRV